MRRRSDSEEKTYFRSERVFTMNGQWYFSTRETDCGPYASPQIARAALARFIDDVVQLEGFQKSRERELKKPKVSLAERLKLATVGPSLSLDAPELLI